MPLSQAVTLRADSEVALLLAITPPPAAGIVTGTSGGQYTVNVADQDAEVLAWPLNGFEYAVGDVVYILLAANQSESGIILGSKAPLPTLNAPIADGNADHGGTTGKTDDDHTQYLLLVGRSGGQTVVGGTASGDDLTLNSTAHATEGFIQIGTNGDWVSIGKATPLAQLDVEDNDAPVMRLTRSEGSVSGLRTVLAIRAQKTNAAADTYGPMIVFYMQDDSAVDNTFGAIGVGRSGADNSSKMEFSTVNAGSHTTKMTLGPAGNLGHGVSSPSYWEHSHDGTSGKLFGTVSLPDGTAVTVIANATGDVTTLIGYEIIVKPSSGTAVFVSGNATPTPTTVNLFNSGGGANNVEMVVNANGSVTIQRTVGSLTYTVSVNLFWQ